MMIFWLFAVLSAIGVIGCMLQLWSVRSSTREPAPEGAEHCPPVSILKPLKGLDDNLFDNLESFCRLDYPEYEIIFALQDRNDLAFKVAEKIKRRYPDRGISIVVQRCEEGLNPKVNNLIPAYRKSKHEYILISDSNVCVRKEYLGQIMARMGEPGVGLVTNPVEGVGARSLGSVFENLHLNSFVMGGVCFLDKFMKMPCVIGKSMLLRKADLEAVGGLHGVKDVLAEDYMIGKKIAETGKKVVLCGFPVQTVNHYWSLKRFMNRHTRWGKLRWRIGGARYLTELFLNAVFMSAMPLVILGPSVRTLALALSACILKIAADFYTGETLGSRMNPLLYLLAPVKDMLIGFAWFVPLVSNTVVWRGNRYIIGRDSALSECPETGMAALIYHDSPEYREVNAK